MSKSPKKSKKGQKTTKIVKKGPKNNYRNADEPYDTLAKVPKVKKRPLYRPLKNRF
jgi:hypothetical protein